MATLKFLSGPRAGHVHPLTAERTLIGREPFCDLVIASGSISRQHALIVQDRGSFHIEDLGSLNGTFVNGVRISGRARLKDRDRIDLYDTAIRFFVGQPTPEAEEDVILAPPVVARRSKAAEVVRPVASQTARPIDRSMEQRMRAVLELTRSLGRSWAVEAYLPKILDNLFDIFPQAGTGYILLSDPVTGALSPAAVKQRNSDADASPTLAPIVRGLAERVMTNGEAILSNPTGDGLASDSVLGEERISSLSAPLVGPSRQPLGIVHLEAVNTGRQFATDDLDVLVSVAGIVGQAMEHASKRQDYAEIERRRKELATAREIQINLLPNQRPVVPAYRFFDYYRAADEVGGDYFGYIPLADGRLAIAMADVSGKGIAAALLMARFTSEVRYCVETSKTPMEAMARLSKTLAGRNVDDRFVTFLLCVLDPAEHVLQIVNAGHLPPLCRRSATGAVEQVGLEAAGPPLGFDLQKEYDGSALELAPGDVVVLYTDGITEAVSPDDQTYGLARLRTVVAKVGDRQQQDLEAFGQAVLDDVSRFVAGRSQSDDMCLVIFERQDGTTAPTA